MTPTTTVTAKNKTYDGAPVDAGSYTVVMNVPARTNYSACEARREFTIAKAAAPTITVKDASGTWRGSEPKYAYTVSGLVDADKDKNVLAEGTKAELDQHITGDKGYKDLDAGVYTSAITVKNPQLNKDAGSNYENGITVKAGTLTIAPVTPTATVTAKNKTYDGAPAEVTCSITDPITGEKLDSAYSLTYYRKKDGKLAQLDGAPVDAGSYTVVMNVPARTNYNACEARCEFTISKAPAPTITANDVTVTWRDAEPAYTYTVSGLVPADKDKDVLAKGTKAELDRGVTGDKGYQGLDAGVYASAITVKDPQLNKDAGANYENAITVIAGTLTVSPLTPKAAVDAAGKTYDGAPAEVTCSLTDPTSGEKLDSAYGLTYYRNSDGEPEALDGAPVHAGSYTVVMSVPARTNYSACEARCDFAIAKAAAPTICVDSIVGAIGAAEPAYTFTVDGLKGKDTREGVLAPDTVVQLDTTKTDGKTYAELGLGTHKDALTVVEPRMTSAGSNNYKSNITVKPGTLTVKSFQLDLSVKAVSKTYDGDPAKVSFTITEPNTGKKFDAKGTLSYVALAGDTATPLAEAPTDAGTYKVILTVEDTGGYHGGTAEATFSIDKATPTLKLEATSKVYDGNPAKITTKVLGVDDKAIKGAGALTFASAEGEALAESPVNAGSYTVTLSTAESTNYRAAQTSKDFTIAKAAAPTITVKDASVVFGEPEPAYSYEASGLAGNDNAEDVIAQGTTAALDSKLDYSALDAGEHKDAITVANPQLSENGAINYEANIKVVPGTLTIEPANVTGAIAVEDKTYDGKPVEPAVEIANAAGKKVDASHEVNYYLLDGKERTEDLGAAAPKNAGSYEAVLRVTDTVNYRADEASCTFTISKAPAPTITANDVTVTWRDAEPAYTYTVSGLVPADKDKDVLAKGTKAELDRGVTGDKGYQGLDAGVYASAITVKDPQLNKDAGANYENAITVIAGTLTVSPLTPKAAVDAAGKTYDGTPAEVTCSVTDPTSGEKLDSSYSLTYYRNSDGEPEALDGAPVDAGSYTVVMNVPARTNYSACEARCDFTIAKAAAPTITVKDASVVFGEPEPAYSFKVNGLVGGDKAEDVIAQGTTAALDSKLDYGALDAGEHKDAITVANPQLSEKGAVNYKSNIKVVAGTLTIEPANVTGTIAVEDKTYDGKPVEPAVEIANAAGKKVDASHEVNYYLLDGKERTEDLGAAAPKNAGSYEAVLRVTDTVNYRADEASCTFTIGKAAAPTITVEDATGTWRGSEPKYVVTVEGLADGETADSVIQSTAAALDFQKISQDTGSDVTSYADLAVGTYADAITVANAQLTDAGKVNYQSGITVIPGTLTVEVTQLTLKLDVASKTYDGAPVTATWSVVDPVTGNALNDLGTLTYYEIVNGVPTKLKEAPTNAGTYLAELSANVPASYTAEPITASFSIYRATPNPDTPQLNDLELRDGLAFADVTIPNDPNGSWSWADGTCAITEAGTESGLAVYTPVDTQNFSRTTCVLSFNVVDGTEPSPEPTPGKPKPTLTIEVTSKVYDGAPASITTEVHDSATSTTEVRNSVTRAALTADGTLTYFEVTDDNFTKLDAAPVNAGHYAVLFEVAETDEYAASSVTTIFDIYRAVPEPQATPHPDPTHPDPALPDLPLTSALKLGDLQLPADDEGTWAWVAPETALTATGTCRFLACYTPNDARNYASVFGWWTFNVVDAAEPDPEPTPSPTPNPTDPGNTKTTKTVTTTTSTTSKIPNTGDRTLAIVASLGIAGGIIVAAALMFIKRRA